MTKLMHPVLAYSGKPPKKWIISLIIFFLSGTSMTACRVQRAAGKSSILPASSPPALTSTPTAQMVLGATRGRTRQKFQFLPVRQTLTAVPSALAIAPHQVAAAPAWPPPGQLLPDSEVIYSPSAIGFDTISFLERSGGFLSGYRQYLMDMGWTDGANLTTRVALENSINPRLLLALLEYQSGSVLEHRPPRSSGDYLMDATSYRRKDLYGQLVWAVQVLSNGYYGWRAGTLTEFALRDGHLIRPEPDMNAGSVALAYFFAQTCDEQGWDQAMAPDGGFLDRYEAMFGNPWERAQQVEPLLPADLAQPDMSLPFQPQKLWSFTAGPHPVWEQAAPLAALDFAPASAKPGCIPSKAWVVAVADGWVVRSGLGVVVQDLDGDQREQTGWDVLYVHIAERDRTPDGTYLHAGEFIGHPSCLGGRSTGTHLHIARKYNGEWIPAAGSIPFMLSGWVAYAGEQPLKGYLMKDGQMISANPTSNFQSQIIRH